MISVTSNVVEPYNANEVVEEIKEVLEDFSMPEDFTYKFAGGGIVVNNAIVLIDYTNLVVQRVREKAYNTHY